MVLLISATDQAEAPCRAFVSANPASDAPILVVRNLFQIRRLQLGVGRRGRRVGLVSQFKRVRGTPLNAQTARYARVSVQFEHIIRGIVPRA